MNYRQADFWTGPWPNWDLQDRAPALWNDLKDSSLVIFKVKILVLSTQAIDTDNAYVVDIRRCLYRVISSEHIYDTDIDEADGVMVQLSQVSYFCSRFVNSAASNSQI